LPIPSMILRERFFSLLTALFFIGTAGAQIPLTGSLTNGLVAYYPLHGDANDYSGNGNNGTPSNITYGLDRFRSNNSSAYFGYQSGASWFNFGRMGHVLCSSL